MLIGLVWLVLWGLQAGAAPAAGAQSAAVALGTVSNAAAAPISRPVVTEAARAFVAIDAPIVALVGVRVIDGTGAEPADDQTVLIDGARIVAVGPRGAVAVPPGAQRVELAGHTVIPGQVDLHAHSYFGGVRRTTQMSTSGPLLYLAYGVTTAMSAGSQLPYHERNMARAIDAGRIPGPRYLISGPYLDGAGATSAMARALESPEDAERVIDYWAREGATWLKVQGRISRDMLGHVVRLAHARGLKVTGHLCSVTFAEAAALGIDALQHGFITASEYVPGKQPDQCPPENMRIQSRVDVGSPDVQASIRALARSNTAVVSTLAVYETFSPERFVPDTASFAMLDPEVRAEVEGNYRALRRGESGLMVSASLFRNMMRWERDFVAAGGLLGAGSDPWGTGFLPGFGNVRNYEVLLEAGFSPAQAVQILSYNGARILGLDATIGAITAGRQADLVVVRGDPVATPRDMYNVVTVFRGGVGYDAAKLRDAARGLVGVR